MSCRRFTEAGPDQGSGNGPQTRMDAECGDADDAHPCSLYCSQGSSALAHSSCSRAMRALMRAPGRRGSRQGRGGPGGVVGKQGVGKKSGAHPPSDSTSLFTPRLT